MRKYLVVLIIVLFSGAGALSQTTYPGWKYNAQLPSGLFGHKSVMLPDGNVLITGGFGANDQSTNNSLIYEFKTGKIISSGTLNEARAFHSLVIVPTGKGLARIYLFGGYQGTKANCKTIQGVEYLDYDSNQPVLIWRTLGNLKTSRADASSAIHQSNFIIINGGFSQQSGNFRSGARINSSERINLTNNSLDNIGNTSKSRAGHLLAEIRNDKNQPVLINCGGEAGAQSSTELLENWIWNTYSFNPRVFRDFPVSFTDIAGVARSIGGLSNAGASQNTAEWYDIKSGWKFSPSMNQPRANFDFTLVAGIKDTVPSYLVAGGDGSSGKTNGTEYFNLPDNANPGGIWLSLSGMNDKCSFRTLNMTGLNLPIATGGLSATSGSNNVEIYQPLMVNDISFSAEEVGRISDSVRIIVKNEWLLPVKVDKFELNNNAEFILTGDTTNFIIPANSSRTVFLRFRPAQQGPRIGELYLSLGGLTNTVKLYGSGIASSIRILTNSVDYGEVLVGKDSIICFSAIRNQGTDTTYIDSVSIAGSNDYKVISPKGRVRIPPGDSLQVCIQFNPSIRNREAGSLLVHISKSGYPCNLTGKGILKYITGKSYNGCDTVNYIVGSVYNSYLTLDNPGDLTVNITSFTLSGGSQNLFSVKQTTPFQMLKGETKTIPVEFSPTSEGTFLVNVSIVHDGIADSLKFLPVCFVVRSKNGSISQNSIDFGYLCVNDSAKTEIVIENPSFFENLKVDSVTSTDNSKLLSVTSSAPVDLKPRESSKFTVKFSGNTETDFNSEIIVFSSTGSIRIPVKSKVVPSIGLTTSDIEGEAGTIVTIPYNSETFGKDFNGNLKTKLNYDPTMLFPNRIVSLAKGYQVDMTKSSFASKGYGFVDLDLYWLEPINNAKPAFGIEFEVLKGSRLVSEVKFNSNVNQSYCLKESASRFILTGVCGGRAGLVKNSGLVLYTLSPNPAYNSIELSIYHEKEISLTITNYLGQIIETKSVPANKDNFTDLKYSLEKYNSGLFILQINDGSNYIVKPIIINK